MNRRYLLPLGVSVLFGLYISLTAASAAAQSESDEQARAAFRLGRAYYDNGDFLKAAEHFEKAYRSSKKPELLYNVYVAYRDANMSREAADALRGYLADAKDIPNRAQLKARLEALERSLDSDEQRAQSQPTPPPGAAQPPAPVNAQSPPQAIAPQPEPMAETKPAPTVAAEPESGAQDRPLTPFILMGVGGAMVLGSLITGMIASAAEGELRDECPTKQNCDPDLKSTKSRGQAMAVTTDILLFGGLATAGVGVALFFLRRPSESEHASQSAPIALGCGPRGCYGSVKMAF